jgi:urease
LGILAQRRLARGLVLNRPEAVALIAHQLHEYIRDGNSSVAELMDLGKKMLGRRHVMGEYCVQDDGEASADFGL